MVGWRYRYIADGNICLKMIEMNDDGHCRPTRSRASMCRKVENRRTIYVHFLERIHLLRPVDFNMRHVLCRKRDIEEVVFVVLGVRHGIQAFSFITGSCCDR